MKTPYDIMVNSLQTRLSSLDFDFIEIEVGEQEKKDEEGKRTGLYEKFTKLTVEVPRGIKEIARMRFSVKIPGAKDDLLTQEELEEINLLVHFEELEVSFIDSRKNVYFRAKDFEFKEE